MTITVNLTGSDKDIVYNLPMDESVTIEAVQETIKNNGVIAKIANVSDNENRNH